MGRGIFPLAGDENIRKTHKRASMHGDVACNLVYGCRITCNRVHLHSFKGPRRSGISYQRRSSGVSRSQIGSPANLGHFQSRLAAPVLHLYGAFKLKRWHLRLSNNSPPVAECTDRCRTRLPLARTPRKRGCFGALPVFICRLSTWSVERFFLKKTFCLVFEVREYTYFCIVETTQIWQFNSEKP